MSTFFTQKDFIRPYEYLQHDKVMKSFTVHIFILMHIFSVTSSFPPLSVSGCSSFKLNHNMIKAKFFIISKINAVTIYPRDIISA